MIASEQAAISAPAMPCRARAPISTPWLGAAPPTSEASAEQQQRQHERAPLPEVVGRAPAEHQEAGERDRVGVDDPLQAGRGEAEARLDRAAARR